MTQEEATQRVREEWQRFVQALPQLLEALDGRWVVFRDGAVVSHHESQDEALQAAVKAFGVYGGFVVAPVRKVEAVPVTAAVSFL